MALYHFKRHRLSFDLRNPLEPVAVPCGFCLVPWDSALLEIHAKAKHASFEHEVDANVFNCFATRSGCRRLMQEIVTRENFVPEATWLLVPIRSDVIVPSAVPPREFIRSLQQQGVRLVQACGTIQGLAVNHLLGSVQNLGVAPGFRGQGLGQCLLQRALLGFRQRGMDRVILEVTCDNFGASRLYERLGWKFEETTYKCVEILDRY
ncbi:MAG: GNAT family N-acetyltransferase [Planctomycetaceae bacterium]|nr:GNAT family N-acetyltransferase [Planctomycetaceae bacterium]